MGSLPRHMNEKTMRVLPPPVKARKYKDVKNMASWKDYEYYKDSDVSLNPGKI